MMSNASPYLKNVGRNVRRSLLTTVSMVAVVVSASGGASARPLFGNAALSAPAVASDAAQQAAPQAAAIAAQSANALSRATQALQSMQGLEAAAHAAAQNTPSPVPNGLVPGGLVVDPRVAGDPSLWINANLPTQSTSNGQTVVTVQQTAQRAVATWLQFNVGRNTVVDFNQQGNRDWIILNRIDATGVPSQIQGQIRASGTVLLINPNGIIFDGSSQINIGSLIASSL